MTPHTDATPAASNWAPGHTLNVKLQDNSGTRYLSRPELCAHYNIAVSTAERWARIGYGPRPVKVGPRRVGYKLADVRAFDEARQAVAA